MELSGGFFIFRYLTSKNEKFDTSGIKQILKMPVFGDMILKSLTCKNFINYGKS